MTALFPTHWRSKSPAVATGSNSVSLIPWVQLAIFLIAMFSTISGTASWLNIKWNREYPGICQTVIESAQCSPGWWSINISFSQLQQSVSVDSATTIGICQILIPLSPRAWDRVMVRIEILKYL